MRLLQLIAIIVISMVCLCFYSCTPSNEPDVASVSWEEDDDFGALCLSGEEEVLVLDGRGVKLKRMTRGFRNKNPMNVVAMGKHNPWLGQVGKDDQGLAKFKTWEHGLRAGYHTLKKYRDKRGINTLFKLTSRYCEGDALRYAVHIGKAIGKGPHEKVDIMEHIVPIMKAIIIMENGYNPLPDSYFVAFM